MKSWNNYPVNQRWLRITLVSFLLVSIFMFLGTQSEIVHRRFGKMPSQDIVGNKGSKSVEEKLFFLDISLILDGLSAEEKPVDLAPSSAVEKLAVPAPSPAVEEEPPDGKLWELQPVDETNTPETPLEGMTVEETTAQETPAESMPPIPTPPPYKLATEEASQDMKYAYLIFMSQTLDVSKDLEKDNYFVAARILVWQLVHNPSTRTKHDVIVMVTPNVSQSRRDRLKRDGAIVHAVDFLHTPNDGWLKPEVHRWDDVVTKMRAWELTLDPVFDDPAVHLLATEPSNTTTNTTLPSTYLVASNSEVWDSTHSFPPTHGTGLKKPGHMNAGFFILAPSLTAFEYYKSLMDTPYSFNPKYPEQNLINYAHRWDGPMPWRELAYTWNIRCPNDQDIEKGLYSVHEKWWKCLFGHPAREQPMRL
ncbi:glycosyltransferase family 8 protein [Bipolaris oryzae ATCC 44560]|uniref:Glycosyltransferase family 8 protein n=1 Tax=Bipolaris oryzae ATCC 44560 TaxID=930090 RepID=W6ZTI0_COCMI|nr:glycosyltransferase family 8 protein [Bipolaris oryzae ATCC 44560]EUC47031.1 glycosyltransferase family 8 protein [Bipolaris oryzae ATCC 44560]